jgi:hypothetical protein
LDKKIIKIANVSILKIDFYRLAFYLIFLSFDSINFFPHHLILAIHAFFIHSLIIFMCILNVINTRRQWWSWMPGLIRRTALNCMQSHWKSYEFVIHWAAFFVSINLIIHTCTGILCKKGEHVKIPLLFSQSDGKRQKENKFMLLVVMSIWEVQAYETQCWDDDASWMRDWMAKIGTLFAKCKLLSIRCTLNAFVSHFIRLQLDNVCR